MSVRSLSSGAEACITRAMELDGDEANAVRSYVLKQTGTDNFCEILVYRVIEFVKSFFDCSDYQACKAMIANSFMHRTIEQGIVQENPDNALESTLKRETSELFSNAAKELLRHTLLAQKHNTYTWRGMRFSDLGAEIARIRVRITQ